MASLDSGNSPTVAVILDRARDRALLLSVDEKLSHIETRARAALEGLMRIPKRTQSVLRDLGVDLRSDETERQSLEYDLRQFLDRVICTRKTSNSRP